MQEEKTGEEVTPIKLFAHTHLRKDKTWVDARSSGAYVSIGFVYFFEFNNCIVVLFISLFKTMPIWPWRLRIGSRFTGKGDKQGPVPLLTGELTPDSVDGG